MLQGWIILEVENGEELLKNNMPKLMDFYEKKFIAACQQHVEKKRKAALEIRSAQRINIHMTVDHRLQNKQEVSAGWFSRVSTKQSAIALLGLIVTGVGITLWRCSQSGNTGTPSVSDLEAKSVLKK